MTNSYNSIDLEKLDIDKRYKIISSLGEGGMGTVFLAQDLKLMRKVAIKVIRKEHLTKASTLTRTKNEGLLLSQLRHPSLASVFEMNMKSRTPYIVQEYISGQDLKSLLNSGRLLNETEAWKLFREQADVLAYLHSNNIVHRDIKPENIIIDNNGKSVLMDFGLALSSEMTRVTVEGNFVGTVKYCPPEVLSGKDGGERADVYQLGLVIYHAMTGLNLVGSFESIQEFIALLYERSWEARPMDSRVPPNLASVIKRVCQFEPQNRPEDGKALLKLIKKASSAKIRHSRVLSRTVKPLFSKSVFTFQRGLSMALVFLCIVLGAFYFLYPPKDMEGKFVDGTEDIFTGTRAFLITPTGFYLFLPSSAGRNLSWNLRSEVPLRGIESEVSGSFKKVAGGWKALLTDLDCPPETTASLTIFDKTVEIAKRTIVIEENLFNKPFEAIFSYDRIFLKWKFNGFSPATIVIRGTFDEFTKTVEGDSTVILTSEIGFGGKLKIFLHLPSLDEESELASVSGENEMALKLQLCPGINSEDLYTLKAELNASNDPEKRIEDMVLAKNVLYLSTRSGHLYCFDIKPENQALCIFRWKKSFRNIPDFRSLKKPVVGDYSRELVASSLLVTDDGVSCYGLGDSSVIYSFDAKGKVSRRMIPYFTTKEAWRPPGSKKERILTYKVSKGALYRSAPGGIGQVFFESSDRQYFMKVKGFEENFHFRDVREGLGSIFCWLNTGSHQVLCTIETLSKACCFKVIARFPLPQKTYRNTPMAFDEELDLGLFSVNSRIHTLKKVDNRYVAEEAGLKGIDNVSVNGLVHIKRGKFIAIAFTGTTHEDFASNLTSQLNFVEVSIDPSSGALTSAITPAAYKVLSGPHNASVLGLTRIDENRFCFQSKTTFFIYSANEFKKLYSRSFFASSDWLVADKNMVMLSKHYNGTIYGLHLGKFDGEGITSYGR